MSAWTPERKARQSAAIQVWRPWEKSTGPRTEAGKGQSSRNAYKESAQRRQDELLAEFRKLLSAQREKLRELK